MTNSTITPAASLTRYASRRRTPTPDSRPPGRPSKASLAGLALVVLAVVPYSTMKVLWLAGSTVGVLDAESAEDMHSAAMLIGNGVTLGLEVLGVCLAVALTRPGSLRIPAWVLFVIAGGATGLLAPIALGVPTGSALQFLIEGDLHTSGMDHMSPWVFAVAYGGFCTLAVGFAILLGSYCTRRWGQLISAPPVLPGRATAVVGAVGLLPFACSMLWSGLAGTGAYGPDAMTSTAQRTFLVFSGLLPLLAVVAPVVGSRYPRSAWLAVWIGCSTAVMQPLSTVLLNLGGAASQVLLAIAAVTVPGAFAYGVVLIRHRVRDAHDAVATLTAVEG